MAGLSARVAAVGAAAVLALGFGGGYLAARATDPSAGGAGGPAAERRGPGGFAWNLFGKPRGANAERPAPPKPDGFAVWRQRVDTANVEPRACVELTAPLDESKSYTPFVQVTPALNAPPAVSVKGSEICVAGLGFTERRVTLLRGLPAKDGTQLAANADVDFTFGERPPFVSFVGDGVILPRSDSDGLGIETINVSRVKVEVLRVVDRNLTRKSIAAVDPTPEGEYSYDGGEEGAEDVGRKVWSGMMPVQGQAGQRTTTVFPLGAVLRELRPGAYMVKVTDASGARGVEAGEEQEADETPATARRWVLFTDMALTAYDGSEALDVVVRSLKTAKPMPGVRVALVARNGEDLAEARADNAGRVRFLRPLLEGEGAEEARMVMAYGPDADFTLLDLERPPVDLSRLGVGGRVDPNAAPGDATAGRETGAPVDGFLYSDRGVYRPGETVHLVALVRDLEARAVENRKGVLVIRRPSGVEARRIAFDKAANDGAVPVDFVLPKTAPRGRWKAVLEMEGLEQPAGELSFAVEDFAPQRLAVEADGRAAEPIQAGENRSISVLARFLYGAPGAGLTVQGEARIKRDLDPFPGLEGYQWGNEVNPYEETYQEQVSVVTDGDGRAIFGFDASLGESAEPLLANVTASVFEPGGRPVREQVSLKLRPRPLYMGVKIGQDEPEGNRDPTVTMDVVGVDPVGRRTGAAGVQWTLVSENWDYDWFQQDGTWQYNRTSRDVVVARGTADLTAGAPLRLTRRLAWGDYRLELAHPASNAETKIRFSSGWGGSGAEGGETPDQLRVAVVGADHAVGDTIEVTLQGRYAGEAQVAVATDRLIDLQTLSVGEKGGRVRLKTSAAWGGGAYVLVTLVQPRDPGRTPKPRRAVGLVYVPLDPKNRKLDVTIGAPEKLNSRDLIEVPIQVGGLGLGGRAKVTVAVVDEGILRLTGFDSPDPAKWYFGKRALSLDLHDDYGRLLDPNLGAPANVNFGADGIGGVGLTTTPIKTVALWSGVVETGMGGRAVVKLPAADYNGQLRLMAVAWTDDAVGSADAKVTVREPVVAELSLPRFLAPFDRAFATLELHNVEGRPGAYTAVVNATNGIAAAFRQVFELIVGQRVMTRTPLNAPGGAAVGKVTLDVTGPEFSTQRSWDIQTRLGWGESTRTYTELQAPGTTFTPPATMLEGLTSGTTKMTVSYSPFRGFDPAPVASALSRYPYGCTEQIVSAAYPHLYAGPLTADAKQRAATPPLLQRAVEQVLDRQTLDGAIGLWRPGDGEADPWLGAFATDFLVTAAKQGAPVPQEALNRALVAMRQISRPDGWSPVSYRLEYPPNWLATEEASREATQRMRSRASAYALYVMAKGGQGDLARLRWWHDVQLKNEPSPVARAQVGAGLAMMGDKARARSALRQAVSVIGYKDGGDWYASPLRDTAAVVALAYEAGETRLASDLQRRLELSVRDPGSLNTQEQARLLQAAWYALRAAGTPKIEAAGVTALPHAGGVQRWGVGRLADARFVNAGTGGLWRTVTVSGVETSAPPAGGAGLSASKAVFSLAGGSVDLASLGQGDRVIVRISGSADEARSIPLVIDDALPAGWEVETVLAPEDGREGPFSFLGELSSTDVQEARDDRYVAALDLPSGQSYSVAYIARAVTPGDFFLPGAQVRDMYRPGVQARTGSGRVQIAPAG